MDMSEASLANAEASLTNLDRVSPLASELARSDDGRHQDGPSGGDKPSMIESADGSASASSQSLASGSSRQRAHLMGVHGDPAGLISESESVMTFVADASIEGGQPASPEEPLAEASADSNELNESYDPMKEFEELLDMQGLRAPLTNEELLWRKAMYCRYRCRLVNLDQHKAQNTWAEVLRAVG